MTQYVYFFGGGKADGNKDMKDMLGGKGAGLAEMTNAGVPVPPGFTISTAGLQRLLRERAGRCPPRSTSRCDAALAQLEALHGQEARRRRRSAARLGPLRREVLDARHDGHDPEPRPERPSVEGLKAKTGNPRFAKDCYRRFIQMFGNVVLGIDKDEFEHELAAVKKKYKAKTDVDLDEKALDEVIARYKAVVQKRDAARPSRRTRASSSRARATPSSSPG